MGARAWAALAAGVAAFGCSGSARMHFSTAQARGAQRPPGPLAPVGFERVAIDDAVWSPRIETNRRSTVEACLAKCEETGRIANFARAGGLEEGGHEGYLYNDSDVYKVLEGIAYTLATHRDPDLERRADAIIAKIAAAQQPDGYLNTHITLKHPDERWSNIRSWHELYCAGHLIEAAVAYFHATGKRELLDVAIRFADRIDGDFGPGKRLDPPGHQELELALLKLAGEVEPERAQRYRALARFFLGQRGSSEGREPFGEYCQDHLPVREQREVAGHAVRAMYQYCAMADLAALDGDSGLLETLDALWDDVVGRKMYVTGGIGPSASNEGFTVPYDLPNDSAYAETCAAIGMALWNHRLFLMSGEGRYADVLEREIYNGLLSGVSLSGDRFFYDNPLGSKGEHHRVPWFDCSCCPSNVVRYLPAIGERIYAHRGEQLFVALYLGSEASVPMAGGDVRVRQTTRYPWEGSVRIELDPGEPRTFELLLRQPGWCPEPMAISIDGEPLEDPPAAADGFVSLRRTWRPGQKVEVSLAMPVQRVYARPEVAAGAGRVALQRGPVVYCAEAADNGGSARNLVLEPTGKRPERFEGLYAYAAAPDVHARFDPDLLGGAVTLHAKGLAVERAASGERTTGEVELALVPYHLWDNREGGEMVVWLPESEALAEIPGEGDVFVQNGLRIRASHCYRGDTLAALNDDLVPRSSGDHDLPRLTFWDHRGTREWVEYELPAPRPIASASVYWFDDTGRGACRLPESWSLKARIDGAWRPLEPQGGSGYPVDADRFCEVRFEPVETDALRLEVNLKDGFSGGVLEWRIGG